jgi:hypothetical protein
MKTVKLYKTTITKAIHMSDQGSGYSLTPFGDDTAMIQGYDDGGRDYILPDYLDLSETVGGEPAIYFGERHCPIVSLFGKPQVITGTPNCPILSEA